MQTQDERLLARWNHLDEQDKHIIIGLLYILDNEFIKHNSMADQKQLCHNKGNSAMILKRVKEADSQKTLLKDNIIIK